MVIKWLRMEPFFYRNEDATLEWPQRVSYVSLQMTGHSRQATGRIRPEADKHVLRIDARFGSDSVGQATRKAANQP